MLSWSEVDVRFYMTILGRVLATVRRLSVLTALADQINNLCIILTVCLLMRLICNSHSFL